MWRGRDCACCVVYSLLNDMKLSSALMSLLLDFSQLSKVEDVNGCFWSRWQRCPANPAVLLASSHGGDQEPDRGRFSSQRHAYNTRCPLHMLNAVQPFFPEGFSCAGTAPGPNQENHETGWGCEGTKTTLFKHFWFVLNYFFASLLMLTDDVIFLLKASPVKLLKNWGLQIWLTYSLFVNFWSAS